MSLHKLSTELFVAVGEFCKPQDAFNLALTCRESHSTLLHVLSKHRKVWRYWNTIDSENSKKPMHNLLLKLSRKPHLAQYVEIFKCQIEYQEPGAYNEMEVQQVLQSLEAVASGNRLDLKSFLGEFWRQGYQTGLEDLQMCILSSCLINISPVLRRLECFGSTVGTEDLLAMLINVRRATEKTTGLPLQHLKSIEIKLDRNISEGGLPVDWLVACMSLPCLHSFATSRMGCALRFFGLGDIPNSNIARLVLQSSNLDPDLLIRVLSKMTSLQSFAYENGQGYETDFSAKKVVTALVEYASHSLENLTIHGHDVDESVQTGAELPYVSLAGFKRLRTLRCSMYLLTSDPHLPRPSDPLAPHSVFYDGLPVEYRKILGTYRSDDFLQATPETLRRLAFATRLPQSLKALHLREYPCHSPLPYLALEEFIKKADILMPQLIQLHLDEWSSEYLERKGLSNLLKQQGLKYKKLPDPFRVGFNYKSSSESESD